MNWPELRLIFSDDYIIFDHFVRNPKNITYLKFQESDTGLGPPALWDLAADKQTLQSEQPLQVARCTKIINADSEDSKYIINVKQFAKFVVDLAEQVASTDIEEGMRVGVDRNKYQVCKYTLTKD